MSYPKDKIEQPVNNDNSFKPTITLGMMGVYDFFNKNFGIEGLLYADTKMISVPLEWRILFGNSFQIKTWPQFFLSKRKSNKDSAVFASLFTNSRIFKNSASSSTSELGIGAGFAGSGVKMMAWISTSFNQGTPTVKDIFSIRTRFEISPASFLDILAGLRIGTAIATGTSVTTSATIFEFNLDLHFKIYKGLGIFTGTEIRTDNFGALLDSSASISGISSSFQILVKLGITYKF